MFNLLKTAVLMAAITALFMAIGAFIGGQQGMMLALVVAIGMNFFSYWFSDKLVLKMYNAREVDASIGAAVLPHDRRARAARRLPMPRVYLIDEDGAERVRDRAAIPSTRRSPRRRASCSVLSDASCAA